MNLTDLQKSLTDLEAQKADLIAKAAESAAAVELAKTAHAADLAKRDEEIAKRDAEITKRDAEIAKLKGEVESAGLKADVEKRWPLTPGTVDDKVAVLKSVNAIENESVRKSILEGMDAKEAELKKFAEEKGAGGEGSSKTAQEKLEKMAADLKEKNPKLSDQQAFAKAADTEEGRKLWAEMRQKN